MNVTLEKQAPYTNQSLDNFIVKNKYDLLEVNPEVKILFVDPDCYYSPFVRFLEITMQFTNPKFENDIVYFFMKGRTRPKYHIQFKNKNIRHYDLINGLLVKDGLIGAGNEDAITVHVGQFINYLTGKEFILDGSTLAKSNKIILGE